MQNKIKLVSLNIEGRRHWDDVVNFLKSEQADVVCLQEVFERDLERFEAILGMQGFYAPMTNVTFHSIHQDPFGIIGNLILSKHPISEFRKEYFAIFNNDLEKMPIFMQDENSNATHRGLSLVKFTIDEQEYTIANTHFTWSAEGRYTKLQKEHFQTLLSTLKKYPSLVLCGDFNSPRGSGGVFDELAKIYHDNIPADIDTTIDSSRHKSGKDLRLVVDGLFSTPDYQINNVRIVDNVSDHKAIVVNTKKVLTFDI